jgi:hypothetical protein
VIEGEAPGADLQSRYVAENICILPVDPTPANWKEFGRAAGPIRNTEMLRKGANGIVAFHNNLRLSKGTANMVAQGLRSALPIWTSEEDLQKLDIFIRTLKGI